MMTNPKRRKIAYITGTRADFGIVTPLLKAIEESSEFSLSTYGTGMHLMKEYGYTIDEVKLHFPTVQPILAVFEPKQDGMATFASIFLDKVVHIFSSSKPDLVLLLGDRVEMLCIALACHYLRIPIAHIHGGDKTQTIDDAARHAITKLSHLHFAPTSMAKKAILQMGEAHWRVHLVGALGLDSLLTAKLLTRDALCAKLGVSSNKKIALVLQHPVSEKVKDSGKQMKATLEAVIRANLQTILVYPNADTGSREMIKVIEEYSKHSLFHVFQSIDHKTFLSLEKHVDVWIGNSSAGIVESTFFKTPVINVGSRQAGRPQGKNIINVGYSRGEIYDAIQKLLHDTNFQEELRKGKSPWGDGKTTEKILSILKQTPIDHRLLTKV